MDVARIDTLASVRIVEREDHIEWFDDWSQCRSPSRARRRRRRHPQRVVRRWKPRPAVMLDGGDTMIVHTSTAKLMRDALPTNGGTNG